jgi:hypothetical protein
MRPLVINEEVRAHVARIKEYAGEHAMNIFELFRMVGEKKAVGDDLNLRIVIPFGYRVIYSQEQQSVGLCDHISISVDLEEKPEKPVLPNAYAVAEICQLFEMAPLDESITIWVEEIQDGGLGAVNVLSPAKTQ